MPIFHAYERGSLKLVEARLRTSTEYRILLLLSPAKAFLNNNERGSVGGKNGCELWTKSQDMAQEILCLVLFNIFS